MSCRLARSLKARATRPEPPAQTLAAMTAVMVERAGGAGACTDADLRAAGFTDSEVAAFAEEARQRARLSFAATAA